MKIRILIATLAILLITVLLKAQNGYHSMLNALYSHTVETVSVEKLDIDDPSIIIIDTRSKKEFEVSHLPGAVWVDYDHFTEQDLLKFPKSKTIVTYCTVGYRSEKVGENFLKLGYKNVYNLYGGLFEWINKGNEVVNKEGRPTTRVHTYNEAWAIWLNKGEKVYE